MPSSKEQTANLKKAFAEHGIPWPRTTTLFWHPSGPLVNYVGDTLRISNLNPEKHIQWRMSRIEMLRLGWRCILTAVLRR